jgi:hypothetical protein
VQATGSDEMCIFKDALGNEWCFEFRSPMFSIGWEWDVDASNGESVMYQLKPYFEPSFYFKTHFIIARIWQAEVIYELPRFKTESIFSFLFSPLGQICVGTGWNSDAITINIKAKMIMKDCYKVIFNDLCDWTNWTGDRAMWLDDCENEQRPVIWQLSKWQIGPQVKTQATLGGFDINGPGCFQFSRWSSWPPAKIPHSSWGGIDDDTVNKLR